MHSPNGKIEVVRHSTGTYRGAPNWSGSIEIPGRSFKLAKRSFYDPMAFSTDSRFLAATESFSNGVSYDNSSRVVVFDFEKSKEIIVYTEAQGGIEEILWSDSLLLIKARSNVHGPREHRWKPGE